MIETTNSAAQNQKALLSAIEQSSGSTVIIPSGVYEISPVVITVPHTRLHLEPGATLVHPGASSYLPSLLEINADNVEVNGGQFDGSGSPGVSGIMAVRIIGNRNNVVVRNCTFRNCVSAFGSYNVQRGSNWLFENNTIENSVTSHGVYLHGSTKEGVEIRNVSVLNNRILNAKLNGIWVGNGFRNVHISGNQITNSGRIGIEVWRGVESLILSSNIVEHCASFGISVSDVNEAILSGNLVKEVSNYGIEVASCRSVSLLGNVVSGVRSGRVKATGISLNTARVNGVSDIAINGGVIRGCVSGINLCGGNYPRESVVVSGVLITDVSFGIRNVGYSGEKDGGGTVSRATITGCTIRCKAQAIGNSLYGGKMLESTIANNNILVVN